ncbi:outer membrane lipoprotein-sorting protein [Sediminispirochaeta smaragdinae]|jgi:hypothetical protein|uniref:Exporters of the RND superfamily-like protein n=1 Tax=Sediminispirochaeta smaragdinae (strain DSM 11293 / JCM 15392 / SEBR 4228) TaxID=573413 RepID=E1R2W7_SEDSS|nr:outer membrane lipoprotein-sorting protein [Sediminispirochaeta smaragdinae]ADK80399.1 exporters of the RND superfamily-like protein [Sediminispirochaeta smaragdinae DSM 11293]
MGHVRKLFILAMLVNFIFHLSAQEALTAKQIQQRSIDATRVDGTEAISTLTIINEKGEMRIRKMATVTKLYDNGSLEKKLVRFIAPADVEGTGFLTFDHADSDDEKWMYLPALRKTRRIVSSENAKSFMGSEFSYADMSIPTVEDFAYRLLTDEIVGGEPCWSIEITPNDEDIEDEYGFSKKISYISTHDFVLRKAVYFDRYGEEEKVMEVKAVREIDPQKHTYRMMEIEMTNVQDNRRSILTIDQIQFNPSIPDDYFTTRYLAR